MTNVEIVRSRAKATASTGSAWQRRPPQCRVGNCRPGSVVQRSFVNFSNAAIAAGGLRRPCSRSRPSCSRSARWERTSSKDRSRGHCRPSSQLRPATPHRSLLSDPWNRRCRPEARVGPVKKRSFVRARRMASSRMGWGKHSAAAARGVCWTASRTRSARLSTGDCHPPFDAKKPTVIVGLV